MSNKNCKVSIGLQKLEIAKVLHIKAAFFEIINDSNVLHFYRMEKIRLVTQPILN